MARNRDIPHNAEALLQLAAELKEAAKKLAQVANLLEKEAPGAYVTVGHRKTVDQGLQAAEALRLAVAAKINARAFTYVKPENGAA